MPRRLIRCPKCGSIQPLTDNSLDASVFRCALSVARKLRPNLPNDEIVNAATDAVIAAKAAHCEGGGASLSTLASDFARQNVMGRRLASDSNWAQVGDLNGPDDSQLEVRDPRSPDPAEEAANNEQLAELQEQLKQLSPLHAKIIFMRFYSGKTSISDIADQLGIPKNKVIELLDDAISFLRDGIIEENDTDE